MSLENYLASCNTRLELTSQEFPLDNVQDIVTVIAFLVQLGETNIAVVGLGKAAV